MPYHLVKYPKGWKVADDKGREYSNNPLPLRRAKAQMRALYANAYHGGNITSYTDDDGHHMLIHGNGFITDIFAKAKKATFGAVKTVLSKAANVIGRPIRNNYPPAARHMLAKYAKATVDNVIIRREPIASLINTALNFISLGKWNEVRAKLNFDKLFHLSMVVQLRNPNAYLVVEKNEVINISDKFKMRSDRMEYITVPVPCCVNFWDFMRKAQEAKGDSFFQYDAFTNNCQMFIDGILNANGINTPEVQQFVLQDVTNLLSDLPEYIQPFARLTTNIAGVADTILQGQGADCCGSCSIRGGGDCGQRNGCGMCGSSNGVMKGGKNDICIPRKDYNKEHRNLIALLERISNGSRFEATKQRKEMKSRNPTTIDTFFEVKGGRLSAEEKARLLAAREDYAKDMRENPQKFQSQGYDPSDGGTKEPCFVNLALDNKEGGLNRRQTSMGYQTPASCSNIQKIQNDESRRRQYNNMSGFQKFAQGFLDVVTPIADVASNIIPGLSGQIYQQFAPPGSAYYSGNGLRKMKGGSEEDAAFEESLQAAAAAPQPAYVPPAEESEGEDPSARVPRGNTTRKFATALERLLFDYLGEVAADNMEGFTRETLPALLNEDLPLAARNKVIRDFINQLVEADVDKTKLSEGLAYIKRKRPAYGNAFDIYIKRYRARNPDSTDSEGFASAEGEGKPKLINQLRKAGFTADEYLKKARAAARKAGYDPKKLKLAYDGVHKLSMTDNDGKESLFGRAGYGDFIIWSKVKGAEFANKKRDTFIKSHSKIKGDWRANNYSPNNLALRILWSEKYPPGK